MIAFLPPLIPPNRSASDLVLRVDRATSRFGRGLFVSAAQRLYAGDSRWIPPLVAFRRSALAARRNQFLAGVELGAFLGIAQNLGLGDEPVGSLAAWPPLPGADAESPTWGSWGLFETINVPEMAERLFNEAEVWLFEHARGLAAVRGPLTIEPLASPGLLTDGYDVRPSAFLPYNQPYYPEMVEAQGYAPYATWRSYACRLPSAEPAQLQTRPITVHSAAWRTVAAAYAGASETASHTALLAPGLSAWLAALASGAQFAAGNWEWRWAVGRAGRKALVVTAEAPKDLAACFGIPDPGPALRASRGRLLPYGWLVYNVALSRTRRLRVFPAAAPVEWDAPRLGELYATLADRAARAGYREMLVAPVSDADDRAQAALASVGLRPVQQFTLYEKQL